MKPAVCKQGRTESKGKLHVSSCKASGSTLKQAQARACKMLALKGLRAREHARDVVRASCENKHVYVLTTFHQRYDYDKSSTLSNASLGTPRMPQLLAQPMPWIGSLRIEKHASADACSPFLLSPCRVMNFTASIHCTHDGLMGVAGPGSGGRLGAHSDDCMPTQRVHQIFAHRLVDWASPASWTRGTCIGVGLK